MNDSPQSVLGVIVVGTRSLRHGTRVYVGVKEARAEVWGAPQSVARKRPKAYVVSPCSALCPRNRYLFPAPHGNTTAP